MSPEHPREIKPIGPEQAEQLRMEQFPGEVLEVFNALIAKNMVRGRAVIRQDDAVRALVARGMNEGKIFQDGLLDVEDMYRQAGWKVTYDKPGYNESGNAYFVFEAPSESR